LKLCCPMCGSWTVNFAAAQTWTDPDGQPHDVVHGKCARCGSVVLVEPSLQAVATARDRLSAAAAIRKVAAGSG
jgi:hypothetical protein